MSPPSPSPTVVFISQLGTDGSSWNPAIERMTSGATTITYDRPGTGSQPPRPAPNPALPYSAFAAELEALLDEKGVTGNLVVVGHSVGSLIARVFIGRNQKRVVGAVHVDGSIPRLSLWPVIDRPQSPDGDGPGATHFDTLAGEIEVVQARRPPLKAAVVSRTPGRWAHPFPADRLDPLWLAYQRQLAYGLNAPLVLANDAGHQIPLEAPALVAHLVDEVVRCAIRDFTMLMIDHQGVARAGGSLDAPLA